MREKETKVLALYCYEVGFVSISELPLLMNLSVFLKECILGKWQNCIFKCATHEFTVQKIVSHNMRYHCFSFNNSKNGVTLGKSQKRCFPVLHSIDLGILKYSSTISLDFCLYISGINYCSIPKIFRDSCK